jgi:hypothetical protein
MLHWYCGVRTSYYYFRTCQCEGRLGRGAERRKTTGKHDLYLRRFQWHQYLGAGTSLRPFLATGDLESVVRCRIQLLSLDQYYLVLCFAGPNLTFHRPSSSFSSGSHLSPVPLGAISMNRLWKSNKSQASIDRLTGSRPSSPSNLNPSGHGERDRDREREGAGGVSSGVVAQPDSGIDPASALQVQTQTPYQDPQIHLNHPAHALSRLQQSSDLPPGYVDESRRRPSVPITIVPPVAGQHNIPPELQGPAPVPGQTQFGQLKQVHVHTEKEHKRSKRSIFGFPSSKDKEKENSPVEKEKKGGLGRSGSIHLLRKHNPGQQSADYQQQAQSPQSTRHSAYFPRSDVSRENLPEDPNHYEQYRQQQQQHQQQQPVSQYNSPTSVSHYQRPSPEQPEDQTQPPRFSPPREQYQPYHQPEQSDQPEQYQAYQGQGQGQGPIQGQGRPVGIILDQHAALRPPSQSSLGPPSPLLQESRPSTAATSRYSTQSVGQAQQHLQQQQAQHMARGDLPPGGRQLRDPRDEAPPQYQQDPRARMSQQMSDQGRNTPPPRNREDPRTLDYSELLQKHEELQAKYSKVKRYYFEREAQVTQLQNTVANQRLSMSKTSLDDAQYSSRFERLSGAINNLAFNIRKDWKDVPPWLRPVCNKDAHAVGTKEMTAVGRACITRWLYETVFQQVFHPAIDHSVSRNLKHIEQNLRRQGQSGHIYTDEQRDDLLTKITTWRLTTIEGLQDQLASKFAHQYQENLIQYLTENLTESLKNNLNDPPPPGLQESVATIIGQAVSICANIPMESRDIWIEYFMPGTQINETYMKVESGMTGLTNPGLDERAAGAVNQQASPDSADDDDDERERDVEAEIREATKAAQGNGRSESVSGSMAGSGSQSTRKSNEGKRDNSRNAQGKEQKSSFLGGLVGKKPPPSQSQNRPQRERSDRGGSQSERDVERRDVGEGAEDKSIMSQPGTVESQQQPTQVMPPLNPGEGRIRFAVFLTVEVRGKMLKENAPSANSSGEQGAASAGAGAGVQGAKSAINVLVKAPVYEL